MATASIRIFFFSFSMPQTETKKVENKHQKYPFSAKLGDWKENQSAESVN